MYKIDSNGSVTSLPAPASLSTEGYWSDGDAGAGILATEIDQDWLNMVQQTLLAVIDVSQLPHSKTDYSQLLVAILSCARMVDTGSTNALVVTPAGNITWPALAALPDGFTIKVLPATSNTAVNPTIIFNGSSPVAITDPLGASLQPLDIQGGLPCELMKAGGGSPVFWLIRRAAHRFVLTGSLAIPVNASTGISQPTAAQIFAGRAAFGSIQNAAQWARQNLDIAGQTVTYEITGAFNVPNLIVGPLVGQAGAGNEVFAFQSGATIAAGSVSCLGFSGGAQATIGGSGTAAQLSNSAGGGYGISASGSATLIVLGAGLNFGACGNAQLTATAGATIDPDASYEISGGGSAHAYIHSARMYWLAGITVTTAGTPVFSTGFLEMDEGSAAEMVGVTFGGSGSIGPRFFLAEDSTIYTGGASQSSYLPGSSAGTLNDNSVWQ